MSHSMTYDAVITVIGRDQIGIIAAVTDLLAKAKINILDISQTILQDMFTMVMLVDIRQMNESMEVVQQALAHLGETMSLQIQFQHKAIFREMQRI